MQPNRAALPKDIDTLTSALIEALDELLEARAEAAIAVARRSSDDALIIHFKLQI